MWWLILCLIVPCPSLVAVEILVENRNYTETIKSVGRIPYAFTTQRLSNSRVIQCLFASPGFFVLARRLPRSVQHHQLLADNPCKAEVTVSTTQLQQLCQPTAISGFFRCTLVKALRPLIKSHRWQVNSFAGPPTHCRHLGPVALPWSKSSRCR
jgi:hypothetical protein